MFIKCARNIGMWAAIFVFAAALPLEAKAETYETPFVDIAGSGYEEAVGHLYREGIVVGTGSGNFEPEGPLSKAAAAVMLQKAFKLAEIYPMEIEGPQIAKKTAYSGTLESINEAFTVPAAKDATGHWGYHSIESMINTRLMAADGGVFNPDESIQAKYFYELLAISIYGVEYKENALERAVEQGFVDGPAVDQGGILTRGQAAQAISSVIGNPGFKIITVFATADIHSHLIPYAPSDSEYTIGSVAKMGHIVKEMKKVQPNVLLVDGGDSPYNTNMGNLFEGRSTVDVMSAMGYDATVLGNHDFDFSLEILKSNAERASYPFLSANTYYKTGEFPEFLEKYIVQEVDGVNIGIIGLTDDQSKLTTHYTNTADIDFRPHFDVAAEIMAEITPKTDIVIALSHLHGYNRALLENNDGILVSIGGGNDLAGPPAIVNGAYLINPGKHGEALNQININILDTKPLGVLFNQVFLSENLPEDPEIAAIVEDYQRQMDERMYEVLGSTGVVLDGERATVRLKESNLGNLVADSQKDYFDADIALQNGGGIRATINSGQITLGMVYETLPFDNQMLLVEATGKTVWDALENGVAAYPSAAGQFLQVAGLSYTFDAGQPVGSRITGVSIDGAPMDLEKTYKVVINDFMAGGGDGFDMLNVKGESPVSDVTILLETKLYIRDIFTEYLEQNPSVAPELEGRIVIINEAVEEAA